MNNKLFTKSIKKEKFKDENLWNTNIRNNKLFTKLIKKGKFKNVNLWNPNEFNSFDNV